MYFSLLSGSFENNLQGGVLRQTMGSFGSKEVDPQTGQFTGAPGIVTTMDAIRIPNDYRSNTVQNDCSWIPNRPFRNGECRAWGNPVAEMMFEGMRYLAGAQTPTSMFDTSGGMDARLGLTTSTWDDPYHASKPYPQCSAAYQLVISDPSPSFDGDQLPGSAFASFTDSSLGTLDVGFLADFISGHEPELPGLKFIGQVGGNADGSPSPKFVSTFRNIRGQAPEAPHRQGSYYAPSVAYYGHQNDVHPAPGTQNVGNFTLALGSPLPSIDVDVGGRSIRFAPFAKTVRFCGSNAAYKPTNAIVNFTVEDIGTNTGSFRVSFEDMEQGADNDMDAVARYQYTVNGSSVTMNVESLTASGCAIQHMGYTVSGSNADGVYLLIRDTDTSPAADPDFNLDVPPGARPGNGWNDNQPLPLSSSITYTPSSTPAAEQLRSPLWYAAKWGGFNDINGDGIPQTSEWDADGDNNPDNYFPVTDPSRMSDTMRSVFDRITEAAGAATAVAASTGSLRTGNQIYQASFLSGKWTGDVLSQQISETGEIDPVPNWSANDALTDRLASGVPREILTYNPDSRRGVPFRWPSNPASPLSDEISSTQVNALNTNPISDRADTRGVERVQYLRGESVADFRRREKPLGDIVHSTPTLVAPPAANYPDYWGPGAAENASPYSAFGRQHRNRDRVVYAGANDGMLHAFDAGHWTGSDWTTGTGDELFAYVPGPVYSSLPHLTNPRYSHNYFVDATPKAADVFINNQWRTVLVGALGRGGQGIYALDITEPDSIEEATAVDTVLWEFTDREDRGVGYIYSTPIIARMQNGKWAAIVANGYNNSTRNVGYARGRGWASVLIIDIETGTLMRKLSSNKSACRGSANTPNSMTEPTAVDLDGDYSVDALYSGDLFGCVHYFDVSNPNTAHWKNGELKHRAIDDNNNPAPITSAIGVGSHPSGRGVMLYFGTGKYLEPSDQRPSDKPHRIYALWDRGPGTDTEARTRIVSGKLLKQSITNEFSYDFDTNDDGVDDDSAVVRHSSQHRIDWSTHEGWYMDLIYQHHTGEQILSTPVLRDGRLIVNTHVPGGNECTPQQLGWLMLLDAASGAMIDGPLIDLNGDGELNEPTLAGVQSAVNPFATPTIVAAGDMDVIIAQTATNPAPNTLSLSAGFVEGRLTWRELQP